MIIKNSKPHLGDALMVLAMIKNDDVYAGVPACNALLMENVKTVPVGHITNFDVDVSDVGYGAWGDYAELLDVGWDGKPAKIVVTYAEVKAHKLPDTGRMKIGLCTTSRDKHRCYPHHKALLKQLKRHGDVYVFGRESLPIRQLVSEVSQLDKMVSVDTGVAHLGGNLGIPLIIIAGPTDCDMLYEPYDEVITVSADKDKCEVKPCVDKACKYVNCMYLIRPSKIAKALACNIENGIAVCRMKGLGDVIMLIPTLYAIKRLAPQVPLTVITSPTGQYMLDGVECIDNIVAVDYKHKDKGLPPPPTCASKYKTINLINAVDFGDRCFNNNRPDNFLEVASKQLGVPLKIDDNFLIPDLPVKKTGFPEKFPLGSVNIGCQITADGQPRNMRLGRWMELFQSTAWNFIAFSDKNIILDGIENVVNTTGELTVSEFIEGVSLCDVLVCTDTAGMHIAPRLNVPVVLLSGSTKIDYHMKYNKHWLIFPVYADPKLDCSPCFDWQTQHDCYNRKDSPWCINRISTHQIIRTIQEVLDG